MPGLDAETSLFVATLMMLANGGLLGLINRDLPPTMRPAATSWQAGIIFVAAGCVTFLSERSLSPVFMVTAANGLTLLGFTTYWHALRQFYGHRPTFLVLLPAAITTVGLYVFAAIMPNTLARIVIVSVAWIVIMGACATTLHGQAHVDDARSRRGLMSIVLGVMLFTSMRAIYYLLADVAPTLAASDTAHAMNFATTLTLVALPILGTTAFVLMCSERMSRNWQQAASTDYLTGLANRRTVTEAGVARFASRLGRSKGGALAMIDIDRFKAINDTYGHDVGDAVLKHVGEQLAAVTRADEMLGRVGGEEFVVLLGDVDEEHQAQASGERLRLKVQNNPFTDGTRQIEVTVSIGVSIARSDDENFDSLLRRADRALYAAKTGGRNRVEIALESSKDTGVGASGIE